MNGTIVYPGTFDPLTRGHEAVIRRAARIFDRAVVLVASGFHKSPLFSLDERIEMASEATADIETVSVEPLAGLLAEYVAQHEIKVVLRGIRTVSDFDFESQLADINRRLGHDVETLFIAPTSEYIHVYSRVVREVAMLGGDVSPYVSPAIADRLKRKFADGRPEG